MKKKILAVVFAMVLVSSNLLAISPHSYEYVVYYIGRELHCMITYYDDYGHTTYFTDGRPSIRWNYGQEDLPCCFGKIVFANDALNITFDDVLSVEIYDILGRSVYFITDRNDISIYKHTFNITKGTYMLRVVNGNGEEEMTSFMFDGNSFMPTILEK